MGTREPSAVSLEKFVLNSLSSIAQETSGRGQAQREVRDGAIKLLEELGVADFGKPGSRLSVPFPPDVTAQLLGVLRGALALGNPRLAEPALSCMHKLVAYAYLQGETGASGRMDDDTNIVAQVVALTAKCGESSVAATQLQVVKALLTYVTAEHFLAHGDCLMQGVRTVFNVAIGAESADIRNTARSALLQMVNTVLKRVGQQIMSPNGTPLPSPAPSMFRAMRSGGGSSGDVINTAASAALGAVSSDRLAGMGGSSVGVPSAGSSLHGPTSEAGSAAAALAAAEAFLAAQPPSPVQPLSPDESGQLMEAITMEMDVHPPAGGSEPSGSSAVPADLSPLVLPPGTAASPTQPADAAPATGIAEAADAAAVAADIAELQAALPRIHTSPPTPLAADAARARAADEASAEQFVAAAVEADARTAQLASLAEQSDLRGLERALDSLPQAEPSSASVAHHRLARQDTPPDPRRALMRDRRAAAWRMLTPVEKDALIVLTAMCKMAARETGFGAVESYMHQGKLLALDLLVRVLTNPMHDWSHMRPEFAAELRHPLCLVLLRNCASPYDQALTAAVRLFEAVLSAQKLRAGLKAELGALYPLLLLKPIETPAPDSAHAVAMAAEGLLHVCSHPQVLVDLFVNYDCSLQAANLYERTVKAIRLLLSLEEPHPLFPPLVVQKLKDTAFKALLAAIKSLDTWAGPIKSAAAAVALDSDGTAGAGGAGGEGGSEGEAEAPRDREELQRILADKELKDALLAGIEAFNRNAVKGLRLLEQSGVVARGDAASAARFLREHATRLDKTQIGELFGHHEEHSVEIMHRYIDGEAYGALTLDEALRRLLSNFRLPGEAQKIDRIMEKFAERYCADNPSAFRTADGAYLLAFAIIMLNTDAHNPMADRRISADDFVSMSQCQAENGDFEQILPTEDLQAIFKRITETEIKVAGEEGEAAAAAAGGKRARGDRKADSSRRAKLAAAVGVTQMVLPFWSGATWDKQHGVDVERRRLLEFTRQMVASGGAVAGNIWHTATHAEHARPMMQVSGDAFLQCLKRALDSAPNMPQALQVLAGYEQAVRLAALLRLEAICEALVAGLAEAAGMGGAALAPHSSSAEAKQVAALSKLVALGSCSEAGMLGSPSWLILLRTLSTLERLQATLLPGTKDGLPPLPEGSAAAMATSLDAAAAAAAAAAAMPVQLAPPPQPSSSFGRLLQRMGFSSGSEPTAGSTASGSSGGGAGGRSGLLAIKDAPGAGHVMWAETAGVAAVERLFSNSAALHGDAVLAFTRALCAVSQEELHPQAPGERPRVVLLQRVVETAYSNMGRIRLVWARLWTLVAQHLVSAACHTDAYVAMYAVDALRQLAAKLLERAELARFTHQGEALRPFAAVLRHSDSPAVRELAVACVAHAVSAHPTGLGSGWRSVLAALALAARDAAPTVVGQALDGLQPAVEALFRRGGHTLLRECVLAVLAGVENPHGFEELSIAALYLFQTLARRLEDAVAAGLAEEAQMALDAGVIGTAAASPGSAEGGQLPAVIAAATAAAQQAQAQQQAQQQQQQQQPGDEGPSHGGSNATDLSLDAWRSDSLQQGAQPPAAAEQQQAADAATAAWQALLVPLAAVARLDVRPRAADAAAAVLLSICHSDWERLSPPQWARLFESVLQPLLALPADVAAEDAALCRLDGAHMLGPSSSPLVAPPGSSASAAFAGTAGSSGSEAPGSRRTTSGGNAVGDHLPTVVPAALSLEGLDRLERHALAHMPELWDIVLGGAGSPEQAERAAAATANGEAGGPPTGSNGVRRSSSVDSVGGPPASRLQALWQPSLVLLQRYVLFPSEAAAVLGVNQLHALLLAAAPRLDASDWQAAVLALQAVCLRDPWEPDAATGGAAAAGGSLLAAAAAAEGIRRRSRLGVLLQRVLDSLLQQRVGAMPGQVQLQLLELLHRTVLAAAEANADRGRRAAADRALAAGAAAATAARLAWRGSKQLPGGEAEAWALTADATSAAGAAAAAAPDALAGAAGGAPPPPPSVDDESGSGAGAASPAWEQLLPALARQEAEGGCLYIAALQRCLAAPASSNGTQGAVAAEAEGRLARFCLWVVARAADRVATPPAGGAPGDDPGTAAVLASAATSVSPRDGGLGSADQAWDEAIRSPLVDAALQAYATLSPAAWARQQGEAFPHLARLVCSPDRHVRRALKALLQRQVPGVLAAGRGGGGA